MECNSEGFSLTVISPLHPPLTSASITHSSVPSSFPPSHACFSGCPVVLIFISISYLLPPSSISLFCSPDYFKACVSFSLLFYIDSSLFLVLHVCFHISFSFFFFLWKKERVFSFKDFVCLLKIQFCFPPHLSLLPCSSALFPVHITVSSEAQSGTDSISIEAPTRPTLLPFPLLLSPLMVFFVFSLGYVLSSVPPSCLTSTPCLYKTVTMLIRWQAGPLWSLPFRKHTLRCLEKYLTRYTQVSGHPNSTWH